MSVQKKNARFTMWRHLLGLHIPNLCYVLPQSSDWCVVPARLCLFCLVVVPVDPWVMFVFVLPWSRDQRVIGIIGVFHLSCVDSFPLGLSASPLTRGCLGESERKREKKEKGECATKRSAATKRCHPDER